MLAAPKNARLAVCMDRTCDVAEHLAQSLGSANEALDAAWKTGDAWRERLCIIAGSQGDWEASDGGMAVSCPRHAN